MSSRVTPPSLSTATRRTRFLPAGVSSTASRSRPRADSGSRSASAIRELSGLNGLTTLTSCAVVVTHDSGCRRRGDPAGNGLREGGGDRVSGVSGSPLSRRAMLRSGGAAGVLGAAVLSGCDLDPTTSSTPAPVAPRDPDQDIVDAARAELTGLIVRLSATDGARSLVAVHRVQLAALDGEPPAAT